MPIILTMRSCLSGSSSIWTTRATAWITGCGTSWIYVLQASSGVASSPTQSFQGWFPDWGAISCR
jgi:hypothetical protein